jgi:hypothetical protein
MLRPDARRIGRWTRLNIVDVWQVLGTLGLLAGVAVFAIMLAHSRPMLPPTGSPIRLLQTLVSDSPQAQPVVEPTPSPSLSATPDVGESQPAAAPNRGSPRVPVVSYSRPPAPTPVATPPPTPIPVSNPTPTPRPCYQKVCP